MFSEYSNLRTTPRTEESAIQETEQEPKLQFQERESLKGFLAIEFDQSETYRDDEATGDSKGGLADIGVSLKTRRTF